MNKEGKTITRYSLSFKQKVVREIEEGKLGINDAKRLYGISGGETIQSWIKKMGKNHLLNKVVRVEMADELNRLKKLETEKQELESALAQAHLRIISLEKTLEVAEEKYGENIGKKSATKVLKKRQKR